MMLRSLRPSRGFVTWLAVLFGSFAAAETLQHWHQLSPWLASNLHDGFVMITAFTAVLALLDLPTVLQPLPVRITRQVDHTVAVERLTPVTLVFHHTGRRRFRAPLYFQCHDHHPQPASVDELPLSITLPPGRMARACYHLRLLQRGDATFTGIDLRHRGLIGMWEGVHFVPLLNTVRVFPDFSRMDYQGLLTEDYWSQQAGIRKRQRRGEGTDFHQLREYRIGDTQRQIDWKATSRRRELITREYQEERDQNVLFLLDAGFAMRAQEGELTHFDHALNSMMLLAHIALKSGDSVGFMNLAGTTERYFAPQKGIDAINNLLNAVYDLAPTAHATDYLDAASRLLQRNPRRSLVILLTNIADSVPDELLAAVRLLRQRHVILIANLRERALLDTLQTPVVSFDSALSYAVASGLEAQRTVLAAELQRLGVRAFDSTPEALATVLVNRYLDIKQAGVL